MDSQTSLADTFSGHYSKGHSRRSVDWRDSGIVIDDDQHFNSIEAISVFDSFESTTSIRGGGGAAANSGPIATTTTTANQTNETQKHSLEHDDDGDTILHLAVVGFTENKVKDLIKICDLNAINNMMQTPLHVAVMANRPEMVQLLIEAGASLNVHDRRGNTPLHLACQKGHKEVAVIILTSLARMGASWACQQIDLANFDGQTCLHLCAVEDRRELIEILVNQYNANLNCQDSRSGDTILHKAIKKFNLELVELILRLGPHCDRANYNGRRPIHTIRILRDDSKINLQQTEKLIQIERMVLNRIRECIKLETGCCTAVKLELMNGSMIDSSSASSSSDYSDTDFDAI